MISISSLTKVINGIPLYENVNFQINDGEKVGLVGPNGSGKTTLFNLIVGTDKPDEGQVSKASNLKISYFSQNVGEMSGRSAIDEVIAGNEKLSILSKKLKKIEDELGNPDLDPDEMNKILEKMGDIQTDFEKGGGYDLETNASEILTGLGILPADHQNPVEDFSGGWKMRIALAKVLITKPDLILMDEPTNYLDLETIIWLEEWLRLFKGAIFMTSHDRQFMDNVVNKIIEVSPLGITTYSGDYEFYLKEREVRKKQNEAQFSRQQAMLKKEEDFIAKFKARASHAAQVQSRIKKIDKIERVEMETDAEKMSIILPEIPRGGNEVILINGLAKNWKLKSGEEKKVFQNINGLINRQDKIALVGVNGAGKSTLLKVVTGKTEPTSGMVKIGPSVQMGYFGQFSFENLNLENTIYDEVKSKLPQKSDGFLRNLLAAMLFKGDDVFKKIKYLSGGEKSRVVLAWLLSMPYNCLILDEPTNHLDIDSREVLLECLQRYEGTLILVSHDRYFLRAIATKVLEIDKGEAYLHPGDYESYLEHKAS